MKCLVCNKEFKKKGSYKTCSEECSKARALEVQRISQERYRLKNKDKVNARHRLRVTSRTLENIEAYGIFMYNAGQFGLMMKTFKDFIKKEGLCTDVIDNSK